MFYNLISSFSTLRIIGMLLPFIAILIIVITIFVLIRRATRFIANLSSIEQMRKALESSGPSLPRSLQSLEKLALPEIAADFPELNIEAMRAEVASDLNDFFANEERAWEQAPERLRLYGHWWAGFKALRANAKGIDGQSVYRVVIKEYNKETNRRHIVWQAGFYYYDGENSGLSERVDVFYTYDLKQETRAGGVVTLGMRCPSCGAPVEQVGNKTCSYCQTALNANWDMVWRLSAVQSA